MTIPAALRVPFVAAEFDASNASQGPGILAYNALMIGQKIATGSGVADTIYPVTSADDLITIAGRGSQLHRMAIAWFASNTSTALSVGVLSDNGAAVVAAGTITYTAAATADGTVYLYLGGTRVTVAVASGDAVGDMATATAAAINANLDLPVTATPALGVVTVTHRNKGLNGNDFDIRANYLAGDSLPTGVALTIAGMSSGATNPVLTNLIAAMGDTWFQIIVNPYSDATSLSAIEGELSDRFGPLRMIDGVAIGSAAGSHSTLTSLGNTRNSQHSCIVAQPGANPLTPPDEFAAETAAIAAYELAIDPARPLQTLPYRHAVQPAESDLFTLEERNLLLYDGIGTTRTAAGGVVQVERPITTYQTNPAGAADTAYLDITTMLTLLYLRWDFRTKMMTKYPRHKLAADGTKFGYGQKVITPATGRAFAVGWFGQMEALGLVEDKPQFKNDLVVQINGSDPNRLDILLPPNLINQLIVTAAQIAFRL